MSLKKVHPKGIALLYVRDLFYCNLNKNQIWQKVPRADGKHELKRGCFAIVLEESEYDKYFEETEGKK